MTYATQTVPDALYTIPNPDAREAPIAEGDARDIASSIVDGTYYAVAFDPATGIETTGVLTIHEGRVTYAPES